MYQYLIVEGDMLIRRNLENYSFERYNTGVWIRDDSLSEIYTGDVRFRIITESEMLEWLN